MFTYDDILASTTIEEYLRRLLSYPCRRCSLSEHDNRIVICRGNPHAKVMMIGEAPGKEEDKEGKPFVGPAGILFDKALRAAGLDPENNFYWGNICKCRPVAQYGSGKENYTPRVAQTKACLPYILKEIELINPELIIAVGATSAYALGCKKTPMSEAGKFWCTSLIRTDPFVIHHPAWVLHSQKGGIEAYTAARQTFWEEVQEIARIVNG